MITCLTEVVLKPTLFCLSCRYQYNQNNVNPVVKKVYFFWICPDTNAFEWFTDLLQYLEERVSDSSSKCPSGASYPTYYANLSYWKKKLAIGAIHHLIQCGTSVVQCNCNSWKLE